MKMWLTTGILDVGVTFDSTEKMPLYKFGLKFVWTCSVDGSIAIAANGPLESWHTF